MTNEPILGTLRLIGEKWHFIPSNLLKHHILPVYQHDLTLADEVNASYSFGYEIEALLIDEFSHPELFRDVSWGMGYKCYKLVISNK